VKDVGEAMKLSQNEIDLILGRNLERLFRLPPMK
jgi:hypothetical protein